jgi:rSAM/selenodomain-associated transferase 1
MHYSQGRLVAMAKAPLAGIAKTRLIPALGAEGAASLQRYLIERQLAEAVSADLAPVELWCAEDCLHPFFLDCRQRFGVTLHCQQGGDLGARLQQALELALREAEFAIVIGCDIPELNADVLVRACEAMQQGADAVIAPAEDGGYTLLGVRQADPHLFSQIEWGSDRVMAQTRERLQRLGWRWRELAELWDVDRPQDLPRLMGLKSLPAGIRQMLEAELGQVDKSRCIE